MSEYIKMNDALIYNYQKDIIDEKDKEIERLNNRIFLLDSEKEMLRKETIEWEEDCKRAYNIINELEKWLEEELEIMNNMPNSFDIEDRKKAIEDTLNKLKELKENSNEN